MHQRVLNRKLIAQSNMLAQGSLLPKGSGIQNKKNKKQKNKRLAGLARVIKRPKKKRRSAFIQIKIKLMG